MKIRRQTCGAYFKGRDGRGTCDTQCQWYTPKTLCPCSAEMIKRFPDAYELGKYYEKRRKRQEFPE